MRDGVGASSIWLPAGGWPTVLAFLIDRFPGIDPRIWRRRCEQGLVIDDAGATIAPDHGYRAGQRVYYYRALPDEAIAPFPLDVLYRDAHLLVVDKPAFVAVMPSGRFLQQTLLVRLRRELDLPALTPLHRIDRATRGLVLFSIQAETRGAYQRLFAERAVSKHYLARTAAKTEQCLPHCRRSRIVRGEPFFRMTEAEGPPNSETWIDAVRREAAGDVYTLRPVSGRKHQLRVHMAALGLPLLNDPLYPTLAADAEDDPERPLGLLAASIAFTDPLTAAPRRFDSQLVV